MLVEQDWRGARWEHLHGTPELGHDQVRLGMSEIEVVRGTLIVEECCMMPLAGSLLVEQALGRGSLQRREAAHLELWGQSGTEEAELPWGRPVSEILEDSLLSDHSVVLDIHSLELSQSTDLCQKCLTQL